MPQAPRPKPHSSRARPKTPEELAREESVLKFRDMFYEHMGKIGFERAEEWRTPAFLSCITKDDVEISAGGFLGKKNNMKLRVSISIPVVTKKGDGKPPAGFTNVLGLNNETFPLATIWINSASEVRDKINEILDLYEKAKEYIERNRGDLIKIPDISV